MPMTRYKPGQIVTLLRQIEVAIANGVSWFLVGTGIEEVTPPTGAPGKIHLWKGMEAPYGESRWIT